MNRHDPGDTGATDVDDWNPDGGRDVSSAYLRLLPPRERIIRECDDPHTGICWTERFRRWWPDKAPRDQYPDRASWARLGPDGWQPRPCRGGAGVRGDAAGNAPCTARHGITGEPLNQHWWRL